MPRFREANSYIVTGDARVKNADAFRPFLRQLRSKTPPFSYIREYVPYESTNGRPG